MKKIYYICSLAFFLCLITTEAEAQRIVNIVNFIRQNDYRVENSEQKLYETVERQIDLLKHNDLPATFLLQYDALVDKRYQQLLTNDLDEHFEVGAWWEITQPQVEDAGLTWRGDHPWVSQANIAFTTGYTKAEREKLVDVYMKKFKEVFGRYPQSVGSWFIDAHTLQYMKDNYQIIASCNCKDQVGTDGYTLWGGYWNQAYYPSKRNAYMPAQNEEQQISVPIFRMLGSDPIYQYDCSLGGNGQGVITLEPVYEHAGMNREWVESFMDCIANQPCLAFSYAQAGQENSFTWEGMAKGLEMQMPLIAAMRQQGQLRVETLGESGKWFSKQFKVTPATAVTAMDDSQHLGNKTVWYNSRYYRANVLMNAGGKLRFRDIHLFDERMKSNYLDTPGEGSYFEFTTLPIVDGLLWSTPTDSTSLRLVKLDEKGNSQELLLKNMEVQEDGKNLIIHVTDTNNKSFNLEFNERGFSITSDKTNYQWAAELVITNPGIHPFTVSKGKEISATHNGFAYQMAITAGKVEDMKSNKQYTLRFTPKGKTLRIDCSVRQ